MNTKFKRTVAFFIALVLSIGIINPVSIKAAENDEQEKVHVIIENTTYSVQNGAAWDGVLVDTYVSIDENSTGESVIKDALQDKSFVFSYGYLSEINGLGYQTDNYMAGWMYTFNDSAPNYSVSALNTKDGSLSDGDELHFMYSNDGGNDIGLYDSTSDLSSGLLSLTTNVGDFTTFFDNTCYEYTLVVPSATTSIKLTPVPVDGGESLDIIIDGTSYKRSQELPVVDGSDISIVLTKTTYDASYNPSTSTLEYKIKVAFASDATFDEMLASVSASSIESLESPQSLYGAEWNVIITAKLGLLSEERAKDYKNSVVEELNELGSNVFDNSLSTTNSRVTLAMGAAGFDATDVEGFDIVAPLLDSEFALSQGTNGLAYALLALDSKNYYPENTGIRNQYIEAILASELKNGGYTFFGEAVDPDMTAIAIMSLAPYYNSNEKVKESIDRSLLILSDMQNDDGTYSSWGIVNSNSTGQVMLALESLGIDILTDERFIKNGYTLVDGLAMFYHENEGVYYSTISIDTDYYTLSIVGQALVNHKRVLEGKSLIYDYLVKEETVVNDAAKDAVEVKEEKGKELTPNTGDENYILAYFLLATMSLLVIKVSKKERA